MPRRMVDSTNIADEPNADLVAFYCDGAFAVSEPEVRARFPNAVLVPISAIGTNAGIVGDCEPGCMTADELVSWVLARRAAGVDPTGYVNEMHGWVPAKDAFHARGVAEPHWWVADYDGVAVIPSGAVAKQDLNSAMTGGHFDVSVVADFWPGVDQLHGVLAQNGPLKRRRSSVATSDNHNVFVKGGDNALWHNRYDFAAAKWVGWQSLGGQLGDEEIQVTGFGQRTDVYVIGTDKAVYHCYSADAGVTFSNLNADDLGGVESPGSLVAIGPAAASGSGGLTPVQDAHLSAAQAAAESIEAQLKAGLTIKGTVGA